MSLSISLPDELEPALRRHAKAVGQDLSTFVTRIVMEKLENAPVTAKRRRSHEAFRKHLESWIRRHPVSTHVVHDSSPSLSERLRRMKVLIDTKLRTRLAIRIAPRDDNATQATSKRDKADSEDRLIPKVLYEY